MLLVLALAGCGPRGWAEKVIALDAESALVVTSDGELGIVGPGARWRAWLDLREVGVVADSLAWNGRAAVATQGGGVVWNPADGAWTAACCGGSGARLGAGSNAFYAWEDGAPGTVGLGVERPSWRHAEGRDGRQAIGPLVVLASSERVALVDGVSGAELVAVDGRLRCWLRDRALVATTEGLVSLAPSGISPIGPWSAPGGCAEREGRLVLFEGPEAGPPDQLVEVPGGRVLPVGPFLIGSSSGLEAPRYLAALRTEASANHWIALDLDDWRAVDGPVTRQRPSQIGVARSGFTSFGWCGEDVIALDGQLGTWHLAEIRGWAGDPGAIADGVAWTRTYERVDMVALTPVSWGAAVRRRTSGSEPFPQCLGLSE